MNSGSGKEPASDRYGNEYMVEEPSAGQAEIPANRTQKKPNFVFRRRPG